MGNRRQSSSRFFGNERGVALLIVLLVTALLIALIFEFAYATRISLNNAVNFRDSQRAYYLARSGIFAFVKYGDKLREYTLQGEWGVVPMIGEGDSEVRFKWEDEKGKLNINAIGSKPGSDWAELLFSNQGIGTAVFDKLKEFRAEKGRFNLISELHLAMSDEDYGRVAQFFSVDSNNVINLNTAPVEVMKGMGFAEGAAKTLDELRKREPLNAEQVRPYLPPGLSAGNYTFSSNAFRVYAYATVGGYTKQIEAVVNGNTITYWRGL